MKTAALYIRVSTKDQHPENQIIALQEYAVRRGFHSAVLIYKDEGISGAKEKRPGLNDLMKDARRKRFDVVIVTRFDRFARSTQHLLSALEEFRALGIDFISLGESIDTTTPMGTMVFTIIAALAEFERSLIQERIRLGLDRARAEGKHLGRPRRIFDRIAVGIRKAAGWSNRKIARELKISEGTVRNALKNPA